MILQEGRDRKGPSLQHRKRREGSQGEGSRGPRRPSGAAGDDASGLAGGKPNLDLPYPSLPFPVLNTLPGSEEHKPGPRPALSLLGERRRLNPREHVAGDGKKAQTNRAQPAPSRGSGCGSGACTAPACRPRSGALRPAAPGQSRRGLCLLHKHCAIHIHGSEACRWAARPYFTHTNVNASFIHSHHFWEETDPL